MLLDCISGSQAYNLNLPGSDTDRKGIFISPQREFYGFNYTEQVASEKNDEVYLEIKRFLDLLTKNNPNILELLSTPANCVLYRHPLMNLINPVDFLSKLCFETFAGYAQTQIKKAKGLNKKINKPMDKDRKTVLDFCYVIHKNGSISLTSWLNENKMSQNECGLVHVDHFRNGYLLYHNSQLNEGRFRGVVSGPDADDIQLSSVPKGIDHLAVMTFNKDGYSAYCREYKEYIEWEGKRNPVRYGSTLSHGKNYDAKNMMHTFRLLNMAEEIAVKRAVIVYRDDREFLLKIRAGAFEFDELMEMVEDKMDRIKILYQTSDLPDAPEAGKAEKILIEIRERFYK